MTGYFFAGDKGDVASELDRHLVWFIDSGPGDRAQARKQADMLHSNNLAIAAYPSNLKTWL